MIKDRGKIKWQGFYMPEHIGLAKKIDWDNKKVERPLLDEHQLDEINQTICEAMEFNLELTLVIYYNGGFDLLLGNVHYVDQLKNELRIVDKFEDIHRVKFEDIIKALLNTGENDASIN
ncbi:YolD-like family protein [Bacillus sp. JJ1562]|uniref:YolD-like family protein n=1 Tax=Bacillus sp. JJ1562 TaxID=3122960 RepID=UPI003001F968